MPRTEARVKCAIWHDEAFLSLSLAGKLAYHFLLEQADLTLCGALALRSTRWARCLGISAKALDGALAELEKGRFIVVDREEEEVWIRTFMRHDHVESVKQLAGARSALSGVVSPRILDAFAEEYPDLADAWASDLPRLRPNVRARRRRRVLVFQRDGFTCQGCGKRADAPEDWDGAGSLFVEPDNELEVDHRTPRATGGADKLGNLQTLCRVCNRRKSDRDDSEFKAEGERYPLPDSGNGYAQFVEVGGRRKEVGGKDHEEEHGGTQAVEAEVFEAWKARGGLNGRTVFTEDRQRKVRARLREYPLEDVRDAASGIWRSEWHVERGQTDLSLALRDGAHLERFRDIERGLLSGADGRGGSRIDRELRSKLAAGKVDLAAMRNAFGLEGEDEAS